MPVKRLRVKWKNRAKHSAAHGKFISLVNFRSWTNGKKIFPFVQCLHQVLCSQCSIWTNGNIFLPFVQVMCKVWTNGKLVFDLLDLSFQIQDQFCLMNFVCAFQRAMLVQNPSTFGQMRPQIRHKFHPIFDENVKSAIWT